MSIAAVTEITHSLIPALSELHAALEAEPTLFGHVHDTRPRHAIGTPRSRRRPPSLSPSSRSAARTRRTVTPHMESNHPSPPHSPMQSPLQSSHAATIPHSTLTAAALLHARTRRRSRSARSSAATRSRPRAAVAWCGGLGDRQAARGCSRSSTASLARRPSCPTSASWRWAAPRSGPASTPSRGMTSRSRAVSPTRRGCPSRRRQTSSRRSRRTTLWSRRRVRW